MNKDKKPLILIVDDVVKNIQEIGNLLIECGYNISVSTNEFQALSTAKNIKPDLILLDVMMPNTNGYEICSEIKKDNDLSNIPVIFLTQKHETKDILKGFSVGGVDFITKPFHKQEVIARIENQIELKFARDLLFKQNVDIKYHNDKLNEELTIAAEYFGSLLPDKINNSVMQTFWKYVPTELLGGDAFGYFNIDTDNYVVYLFDVCGHGIASGMYSVSLINTLKYQNLPDTDFTSPESVFQALNKIYQINEHYGMYFTIWYGVFNRRTRLLKFASAGHHPAIVSFPDGSTDYLASPNFIVGGLDKYNFISREIYLEPNCDVYVFSDGTFDVKQPDGTIWKIDDMRQFIEARHSRGDKELNELYDFVSNLYEFSYQKDDFTILKVRFK
jgi:sigma-B regulation protein RsbU (phosphoserine phosphatase)